MDYNDLYIWVVLEQVFSASLLGFKEIRIASPTEEELAVFNEYGDLRQINDDTWILKIYPSPSLDKEKFAE